MPRAIAVVCSERLATLVELQTVLGAEDLYNLLEIVAVDRHNARVLSEPKKGQ
ncbi:hypothetical protein BCh11DRAFT_06480 [Burkholderia sp. Ch1-1]|nr:hypothetical protein BCh11DRAFT_06480 [Burkholderia sp. Ch1-1]